MTKQISVPGSGLRQKRKFWQAHVKAWKKSGLSQAEYCRRQSLDAHRLGYWVKKSATADRPLALVEVSIPKMSACNHHTLKLVVDNRHQLEIADHFSAETLEQVLLVLRKIA